MNILKTIVLFVVLLGNFHWNTHTHSSYFTTPKFTHSSIPHFTHSPIHPFFTDFSPFLHLPTLTPFPADTLSCQASVTFSIGYSDTCTADTFTLRTALDLDIQDLNQDSLLDSIDFIADEPDANPYFTDSDSASHFQGDFPIGKHALKIELDDTFGESLVNILVFEVWDNTTSKLNCKPLLRIDLLPTSNGQDADNDGDLDAAFAIIRASDLIEAPVYDCTGQGLSNEAGLSELTNYAINCCGFEVILGQDSLIVTCDNDELTSVEIQAMDESGNRAICNSTLFLPDSTASCGPRIKVVSGIIETIAGRPLADVQVIFEGDINGRLSSDLTGYFRISDIPYGADFKITPNFNTALLEGVSTLDVILIRKHLLQITPLVDPYKLISADINNDQLISTMDIIELQASIIGRQDAFTNNTSWRFVVADYTFPDPVNPWSELIPEEKYFHDIINSENIDFIAIKIGDINDAVVD